jgi:hypothetical protein
VDDARPLGHSAEHRPLPPIEQALLGPSDEFLVDVLRRNGGGNGIDERARGDAMDLTELAWIERLASGKGSSSGVVKIRESQGQPHSPFELPGQRSTSQEHFLDCGRDRASSQSQSI